MQLNQIVALVGPKKAASKQVLETTYQRFQKPVLFSGIDREFTPLDDDGERFPPESQRVQTTVNESIDRIHDPWIEMVDFVRSQDENNGAAFADIIVDGAVILEQIPVTTLIFLEKQMNDLHAFCNALPTLDPADNWNNNGSQVWVSDVTQTHKTKKLQKPIVKYDATKEHPAQTEMITEDVIIGHWQTKKLSGGVRQEVKDAMLKRITKLKEAIVTAREAANSKDATITQTGKALFNFIFGKEN